MALATAAGPLAKNEDLIANTLADCAKFQDYLGVASKAAALAKIYFSALDPPSGDSEYHTRAELEALRPFAILWLDEEAGLDLRFTAMGGGGGYEMLPAQGLCIVRLEKTVGSGTPEEEDRAAKNEVGLICRSGDSDNPGLVERSGTPGYAALRGIRVFGPWRTPEDQVQHDGDFFAARLELEFGVGQR